MPLNINIQQILLHAFNFVLLFGILYFLLYKPVKDFMEKRKHEYEQMDARAHEDMKNASDLKKNYEAKMADADDEISKMRAKALKNADDESAKIIESANLKADEIVAKAHKKAEAEAGRVNEEAKRELADYVSKMAEKLVMGSSDNDGFDAFFETAEKTDASEG